ncbi:MAG: subtype A tannase [Clostridium sp.]|uniref:subtype A tannase n=1 Tax=Clostridium sp. TaxID=1506 RepID=UPI002901790C|nr:subtype A tannase [Clostridium sp.]MDU1603145.1 subtype A tannase [Clostridium sp.]
MILRKKCISILLLTVLTASLCACGNTSKSISDSKDNKNSYSSTYNQNNEALKFDTAKWNYDETNNVYWTMGVQYCSDPESTDYETMAIYVPGEYMTGTKNSDGTYTCEINKSGEVNGYTSETAPIILPIDTPGYSAQAAPTSYNYDSAASYLKAGYVYVVAGMRGRSSLQGTSEDQGFSGGAPWGVTDLKAAVRYYRFNESLLPGDTDRFFSYGMSGGGAQSALMGATGDSELYYPYLESIGSAMTDADGNVISDAIAGSMDWCPVTSLDYANEAYEWNMGQYFTTDTRDSSSFKSALSKDMAASFAEYVNKLGLKSEDGTELTLSESEAGVYNNGTYYDYILNEIQTSLNNFLSDTTFPYTYTQGKIQIGNTASSGGGEGIDLSRNPGQGVNKDGQMPPQGQNGGRGQGTGMMQGGAQSSESKTYETAQEYIDSLNSDGTWIAYDSQTNTAKITSVEDFVKHCKEATKPVGAFDSVDLSRGENNLFGNGQSTALHFDSVESSLLSKNESNYSQYSDWDSSYITSFEDDLKSEDSVGTDMQTRVNMYNPMYYLSSYYSGYNTSKVAKYWRIRTGINQTDTALTVETNLKLALQNYDGVESVDFATVWGQPHTTAERTGNSTDNFISWVDECLK